MTLDEIITVAKSEKWSRRQIKDACFEHKIDAAGRDQAWKACGFATAAEAAASQAEHEAKASNPAGPVPVANVAVRTEPSVPAAPIKLEDGAIIYCDAAENTVRRVVNSYGKIAKFDNGGYRIGLVSGELVERHYNTQCPDQFAAECFAALKAVELAVKHGLSRCTIRNDRIGGFAATTKRGYKGATYLWVAKKLADEHNLTVTFDVCSSEENEADAASRSE